MDLQAFMEKVNLSSAYPINIGARIGTLSPDYAEVFLNVKEEFLNISGIVQGGIPYTIADFATGMASKTRGKKTVTLEAKINYIRPVSRKAGELKAVARTVHAGRKIGVYTCEILDQQEKLLASAVFTYFFLPEDLE